MQWSYLTSIVRYRILLPTALLLVLVSASPFIGPANAQSPRTTLTVTINGSKTYSLYSVDVCRAVSLPSCPVSFALTINFNQQVPLEFTADKSSLRQGDSLTFIVSTNPSNPTVNLDFVFSASGQSYTYRLPIPTFYGIGLTTVTLPVPIGWIVDTILLGGLCGSLCDNVFLNAGVSASSNIVGEMQETGFSGPSTFTWSAPGAQTAVMSFLANAETSSLGFAALEYVQIWNLIASLSVPLIGTIPLFHYPIGGLQFESAPTTAFSWYHFQAVSQYSTVSPSAWYIAGSQVVLSLANTIVGMTQSERQAFTRWTGSGTGSYSGNQQSVSLVMNGPITETAQWVTQYAVTTSYSVVGGGNPLPPTLSYTSFGNQASVVLATTGNELWADSGTAYSLTSTLGGSGQFERWRTDSAVTRLISGPLAVSPIYYHQFLITPSYSVVGTSPPELPVFSYSAFGTPQTAILSSQPPSFWADIAPYSFTNPLGGSTSTERWYSQTSSGVTSAPGPISIIYTHQFFLSVSGGNGGNCHDYWYDSGSVVTIICNNVWDVVLGQSRLAAIDYMVDGGATKLARSGSGTFSIDVSMNTFHVVRIDSVTQYSLSISGGGSVQTSPTSLTGDSFYDSGSAVTVTSAYIWGLTNGNTRQSLVSFSLDGSNSNIIRAESGMFMAPTIAIDKPHTLAFNSTTQYLVSFQFKDNSGVDSITPTAFQIQVNPLTAESVPESKVWLDTGTNFQIVSVTWENENVGPANNTVYTVGGPVEETILVKVFNAKLMVSDYLGIPAQGAHVVVTLANGTSIQSTTGNDGSLELGLIPFGTFHAEISYLGSSTAITGNTSTTPITTGKIILSYPTLVLALVVIVSSTGFMLYRRSRPPQNK